MLLDNLETELASVNNKLAELNIQKINLQRQIVEERENDALNRFTRWNIKENDLLICFTKTEDEFCLVQTLVIDKIDIDRQYFRVVQGKYYCVSGETRFHCESNWISFSTLKDYEDKYTIAKITRGNLQQLIFELCNLTVNKLNFDTFVSLYADELDRIC